MVSKALLLKFVNEIWHFSLSSNNRT